MTKLLKRIIIIFITVIIIITVITIITEKLYRRPAKIKLGVTFSPRYARYLKLDWQKVYLQILYDLKVNNLRIPSYWNSLEIKEQSYDFSQTDFMLSEAKKAGAKVFLVVGERQPRWPECHIPDWAKRLSINQRQQKILELIQKVVERYRDNDAIWAWQVENEPLAWWFGENCNPPDQKFLQKEVDLVKKLDKRPVMITDSGEWGFWADALSHADILGVSVYRKAYNSNLHMYTPYLFPAGIYQLKASLVKSMSNQQKKNILVSELQAEPWLSGKDPKESLPQKQSQLFSLKDFKENLDFGKKIGFEEIYFWGVEWWYFMAQNGYPQYLDYAKSLFIPLTNEFATDKPTVSSFFDKMFAK